MGSVSHPHSAATAAGALQPTWEGYVGDTKDALILFEATISGEIHRVVRRPHDRERASLIKSGSIFIYEESASGIKRWTDGVPWSPSRILNNFLIYRELEKPFPPGEKKRAAKKGKRSGESSDELISSPTTPNTPGTPLIKAESAVEKEAERSLVGSLTDSYAFKEDGLVKKTMSVTVDGIHYHLVSYYRPEDVKQGLLQRPMATNMRFIQVRPELIHRQNFRAPIDDADDALQSPTAGFHGRTAQYLPHANYMQQPQQAQHAFVQPTYATYDMPAQHQQHQMYQNLPRNMPVVSTGQQHPGYYPNMAQHQHQHQAQHQQHHQHQQPVRIDPEYATYHDPRYFQHQDQYGHHEGMGQWPPHGSMG